MSEAAKHPHNVERQTFVTEYGMTQPAPAPRFSRTPGAIQGAPKPAGADTRDVLASIGLAEAAIEALFASGAVR
jgi:alpha-methylacyl-CoA racemase